MPESDWIEIARIERLKYRYLRCLDLKRWEELTDCFCADASAAYSDGKYSFQGRDAILGFLRQSMGADSFHSSHRVHHPEIDLLSADEASGIWALDDVVIETRWQITIRGSAYYEDRYRKEADGAWRIAHTGYRRIFEEMQSRQDVPGLKLSASRWQPIAD